MHKIGRKENYFKSTDVSMLVHGFGVSQYPQFCEKIKIKINCYHFHMWEVIQVKRVTNFWKKWILALAKSVEIVFTVSISDMPTIKYWQNLGKIWILQKRRFKKMQDWWYMFYVIGNYWRGFIHETFKNS